MTAEPFGFLISAPNPLVARGHPKALPVILTQPAACRRGLSASIAEALQLQCPSATGAFSSASVVFRARG